MGSIYIERITTGDLAALQSISKATFCETFSVHNSVENMRHYLDTNLSEEKLMTELGNPGSEFYFAKDDTRVMGYLKINTGPAQTELKDEKTLEIERIYVSQEYQGRKIGQLLYDWALQIARDGLYDYIWLGVWEHNAKAIRFYEKNGFTKFDQHAFWLGDDEQTDLMMKKTLH